MNKADSVPVVEAGTIDDRLEPDDVSMCVHKDDLSECDGQQMCGADTVPSSHGNIVAKTHHFSKSEKKKMRYALILSHRKASRRTAKLKRKACRLKQRNLQSGNCESNSTENIDSAIYLSKRERLKAIKLRLQDSLVSGQRICVDLGLESFMSPKECSRLAQQLCRLYGSNRNAKCPVHLYFTSINRDGFLYRECIRKNVGFENYMIEMTEKSHLEIFKQEEVVYLSPNSSNVLCDIDENKVYIIGGLVDESIKKNVTQSRADVSGIQTARLPINEHMDKSAFGSYNQILTVNQVFDILLAYMETRDWTVALPCGIPERKGFVIKDNK